MPGTLGEPTMENRISANAIEKSKVVLHGKKTLLRAVIPSDIDDAHIMRLNDPEVVRFSNQRFLRHDVKSCLRYLASFECTPNMYMSARRMSDNSSLGTLTAYFSYNHGTVDVGIMLGDKSAWGQGYGQDAWNSLVAWLIVQPDIRKVTAGTMACNFGMIKLMDRSGMKVEAVRMGQELFHGKPVDILYYARFRDN